MSSFAGRFVPDTGIFPAGDGFIAGILFGSALGTAAADPILDMVPPCRIHLGLAQRLEVKNRLGVNSFPKDMREVERGIIAI